MNSLNSVLIEGTVITAPTAIAHFGVPGCICKIQSVRIEKVPAMTEFAGFIVTESEEDVTRNYTFTVEASGRLSEACVKNISIGLIIRVVGRLKSTSNGVVIVAEHVDSCLSAKPFMTKPPLTDRQKIAAEENDDMAEDWDIDHE
jgi:hypothetical protein